MLYIQENMGHALMETEQLCCRTGFAPARGGLQDPLQWIYAPPPPDLTYLYLLHSIVEDLDVLEVQ